MAPGGTARFVANATRVPAGDSPTFAWSVSGAGATAIPPADGWALSVQLGQSAGPIDVGVTATIAGVTRTASLTYWADTQQTVRFKELICLIKREVQVNWWVDPLWDPLRDLRTHPYSGQELERLRALGVSLGRLASEALRVNALEQDGVASPP